MRYDNFSEFEQEFIKQNPHITILPMYYKHRESYRPWYDSKADYNTNAKSYYDYLGRFNGEISSIIDMLNRAMRRNIEVEDTESIDLTKLGDWICENECDKYSDVIDLKADIKLSEKTIDYRSYKLKNSLKVFEDGVFSPDYTPAINEILDTYTDKLKDYFPSVKDYGAKGDGVTSDDDAFNDALNKVDYINITSGVYRISHLKKYDNKVINGIGKVKIILDAHLVMGNSIPLLEIGNGCVYNNIEFVSEPLSREWNRGNLQERKNVVLNNCGFIGFSHVHQRPNAWGLYLDKSKNIYINNCYFDNNTQSDIAIVEGCENIYIDKCRGVVKNLHINIEPNTPKPKGGNILISNNIISMIELLENTYSDDSFKMITLSNNIIEEFKYKGLNVTLINNDIKKISTYTPYDPAVGNIYFGGVIESIGTFRYSENLITDNYINDLSLNGDNLINTEWGFYSAISYKDTFVRQSDIDGKHIHINPKKDKTSVMNFSTKNKINVDKKSWYQLDSVLKPILDDLNGYYRSIYISIVMYNDNDEQIGNTYRVSSNRFRDNELKNLKQSTLIYTGESSKISIMISPSLSNNIDSLKVYYIGLRKISNVGRFDSDVKVLGKNDVRSFYTEINDYTKQFENNDEILGKDNDLYYKKIYRNGLFKELGFK